MKFKDPTASQKAGIEDLPQTGLKKINQTEHKNNIMAYKAYFDDLQCSFSQSRIVDFC